jgi:ABC-2 type transport system ATP-binding protein
MQTIEVIDVSKKFGEQVALDNVSFEVNSGEIFGLLGPNGAGKTTCIRIILDIYKADSGRIKIFNKAMSEDLKNTIGYLPEERGLYQDIKLDECLVYLASLKGLSTEESHKRVNKYLEQFNLAEHKKKKVKELSKGMQQKAQLITTLVHDPKIIIIDEPFSALDPVNTQMVKDLLKEQRSLGKTIVMCTHQMHQVEQLCDRLVLINQGQTVLYGALDELVKKYTRNSIIINTPSEIPLDSPGLKKITKLDNAHAYKVDLEEGVLQQEFLKYLLNSNLVVEEFKPATPTLDEIFIRVVNESGMMYE